MARGTLLRSAVQMLKAEIGDYAGPSLIRDDQLRQLLATKQRMLATEYDWPFLERFWDKPIPAGERFVTFPDTDTNGNPNDINLEKGIRANVLWNDRYMPLEYGIGPYEYNLFNPDVDEQSDPIQRWRIASNSTEETNPNQFEVWPVPVSDQVVRFTAQRSLEVLLTDDDKLDLDDILCVYFVAGELLQRSKQTDAAAKMSLAQRHLQWLRQSYPTRQEIRTLGRQNDDRDRKRLKGIVIIH